MKHDDARLLEFVRSALPPVVPAASTRDLWPLVVSRGRYRPKLQWLDIGLAAVAAIALWAQPNLILYLAYHF